MVMLAEVLSAPAGICTEVLPVATVPPSPPMGLVMLSCGVEVQAKRARTKKLALMPCCRGGRQIVARISSAAVAKHLQRRAGNERGQPPQQRGAGHTRGEPRQEPQRPATHPGERGGGQEGGDAGQPLLAAGARVKATFGGGGQLLLHLGIGERQALDHTARTGAG